MFILLIALAGAFVASLLLTRVARATAVRCGAVDRPDGMRKLHLSPVPNWGGMAVFGTLLLGMLATLMLSPPNNTPLSGLLLGLAASASLIFALGVIDDAYDLPARWKLGVQLISVLPLTLAGQWEDQVIIMGHTIEIGYFGVPLAVLWLLTCLNAVNLLDGMDGHAAVVAVVASGATALIAWGHGQCAVAVLAAVLAGAILGFLVFNLPVPRATIFLGDAGATVIGLSLGALCLAGATIPSGELRVALPLVTMTIPILDTTLAVVRRRLTGRRFDMADRGHIHHRMLERGLSIGGALVVIGVLGAIAGAAAVVSVWLQSEPLGWIASLTVVLVLVQFRIFGHYELMLLANVLRRVSAALRRAPSERPTPVSQPTPMFDEAWPRLIRFLSAWSIESLDLRVVSAGQVQWSHRWTSRSARLTTKHLWRTTVSFSTRDDRRVELSAAGGDSRSAEPRYLATVNQALRIFGRYWAQNPVCLPIPQSVSRVAPPAESFSQAA